MDFIVNKKIETHAIIALHEVLDIIIAVIVNLVTQDEFTLFSLHNLVMIGILVFLVAAHILCAIIQHNASSKTRTTRLLKAFQEHGGYDTVAEEMKDCIKRRDYRSMKDLRKMVDLVER